MEGIMKHWSNLSLNERKNGTLNLSRERSSGETILAAKFFTKRALSTEVVIRTFNPLWCSKNGFQVRTIGNHILLFAFDNKEEAEKILSLQPLSFDKHLVVLCRYDSAIPISELNFNRVTMWVQVHDIPIPFLNRGVAEDLCNVVGEVCKDTKLSKMEGGHYFLVKTTVDVTIPLCRGQKISLENGETGWVSFKYERLPIICYWCGCLDHADKDCDRWIESNGTLNPEDREYGPWIRASPFVMPRKTVIKVPGYYDALKKERGLKTKSCEHPATANPVDSSPATQIQGTTRTEPAVSINDDTLQGDTVTIDLGKSFTNTLFDIDQEIMKFDSNACTNQGVNAVEARATEFDSNLDSSISLPITPTQPLNLSEHVQHHIPHPNPIPNTCIPDNAPRTWKRIP